jgi:L-iditol 2-dehydrogenase
MIPMYVAMYYSNRDIRIEEMAKPHCGPGELLMKVEASGICGSDVMEWYRRKKAPLVLGHEVAGQVEEIGEGVVKFKKGDRIVAAHHVPCNTCSYCLTGYHTACETLRRTNFYPGGFAEYVRLPQINVDRGTFLIPDGISYEEATFHEPLGCVLRALRNARLLPGQNVLIIGSGIAGLLMIHASRILGAGRILAIDPVPFRRGLAEEFGAERAISPEEDQKAALAHLTGGRLADLVLVCTGAEKAQKQAVESVERGGKVVFFALPDPEVKISFSVTEFFGRNDRTMMTSYGSSPYDSWAALELMRSPLIRVKDMITHRLPLKETAMGFQIVEKAQDSMKVIIKPHE